MQRILKWFHVGIMSMKVVIVNIVPQLPNVNTYMEKMGSVPIVE